MYNKILMRQNKIWPDSGDSFTIAKPEVDFDLLTAVDGLNVEGHVFERSLKSSLGSFHCHLTWLETNSDYKSEKNNFDKISVEGRYEFLKTYSSRGIGL